MSVEETKENIMKNIFVHNKPWGSFKQFTHNQVSTVKILRVNPGEELSYQYHDLREEYWEVIEGKGYAILNDEKILLNVGDHVFIKKGDKHRLGSDSGVKVLEICFGEFDEKDNHRLEDNYGREGTNHIN